MDSELGRELPARCAGLVSSEFGGEFVVVDPVTGVAHALSGDAAVVWRCGLDGSWPGLSDRRVSEVVAGLTELGLLEPRALAAGGVSRRAVLKAGAAGGASLALLGVVSMALPAAALADSTYNTVSFSGYDGSVNMGAISYSTTTGTYYLSIPADGAPVGFSLYGAGGGAGGGYSVSGGSGAAGALVTGSITNNTGSPQVLTVYVGQGGGGGGHGDGGSLGQDFGGGAAGSSGLLYGGGGTGSSGEHTVAAAGGGGGGASAIQTAGATVLVVAGAGGGGGGSVERNATANAPSVPTTVGAGVSANPDINGGSSSGVGGGGGGAPAGNAVQNPTALPIPGGAGGYSWWQTTADFTVTVTSIAPDTSGTSRGGAGSTGDGKAGTDGSATFMGYNIAVTTG